MDFNKAIRKQKKSYKRFLLSMCFVFFVLPVILILSKKISLFLIVYLVFIETLILVAIVARVNEQRLEYMYKQYKIQIKQGILAEKINIVCDKVIFVHADKEGKEMEIILVTTSKFRSKQMKSLDEISVYQYRYLTRFIQEVREKKLQQKFYYLIIKAGGYEKYRLLDLMYTSCVYAKFTEKTIENIKEYRK